MNKWGQAGLVAAVVVVVDQITKIAAVNALAAVGRTAVIDDLLNFTLAYNPGVAFGVMSGGDPGIGRVILLIAVGLIALTMLAFFLLGARPHERVYIWGLGLVAGGAIGNTVDRVRLGAVIDFIDVYYQKFHWPTFNVADAAITIGALLIAIHLMRKSARTQTE
jgi:signal peptidase II